MAKPEERIYDGLAQVAHAIRRSTALTVAMQTVDEDATIEQMLDRADELAVWLRGTAEEAPAKVSKPLGEPFNP